MKFKDIKRLTTWGSYEVDISWEYLEWQLEKYETRYGLDLDPDFQRGHVWTEAQQKAYIEYILRGGKTAKTLLFNCAKFHGGNFTDKMVLVDGKQRLNAVMKFIRNQLAVFDGVYFKDFEDNLGDLVGGFRVYINELQTRAEVLQWYLEVNSGTPHSESELSRVKKLLELEIK